MKHPVPEKIRKDLNTIAAILQRYGVKKIILYGSLARGDFHLDSDIDICIHGLKDEYYFRAFAECLMQSDTSVSILDFKNTYGELRHRIETEGQIIYEVR